jgi:hypothetical protein
MTDQTEDFRDYITQTAKMRAYRGKVEPGTPLAPKTESTEPPKMVFDNPALTGTRPALAAASSPAPPICLPSASS